MTKDMAKNKRRKPELTWKFAWWFIWEDNSILSWVANAVIAFILIKFIVYPGLGFMLDTSHPIVAVVSGSMEHKLTQTCIEYDTDSRGYSYCAKSSEDYFLCGKSFDEKERIHYDTYWNICEEWYIKNTEISKSYFRDFRFHNGFNTGDIMILVGKEPENLKIGDVIVYQTARPDPIIHRIVNIFEEDEKYYFQTKGDHNPGSNGDEYRITEEQIIGKAVLRIPLLGWIKIGFVNMLGLEKIIG
ncbi:MAG: signal peptidase I [Nanoarchaeota archaeon]|nr:signal peptidase I [Nanoarchaeota archaeon]